MALNTRKFARFLKTWSVTSLLLSQHLHASGAADYLAGLPRSSGSKNRRNGMVFSPMREKSFDYFLPLKKLSMVLPNELIVGVLKSSY